MAPPSNFKQDLVEHQALALAGVDDTVDFISSHQLYRADFTLDHVCTAIALAMQGHLRYMFKTSKPTTFRRPIAGEKQLGNEDIIAIGLVGALATFEPISQQNGASLMKRSKEANASARHPLPDSSIAQANALIQELGFSAAMKNKYNFRIGLLSYSRHATPSSQWAKTIQRQVVAICTNLGMSDYVLMDNFIDYPSRAIVLPEVYREAIAYRAKWKELATQNADFRFLGVLAPANLATLDPRRFPNLYYAAVSFAKKSGALDENYSVVLDDPVDLKDVIEELSTVNIQPYAAIQEQLRALAIDVDRETYDKMVELRRSREDV